MADALPPYEDALGQALRGVEPLGTENVPLADAAGRVLATPLVADRDLPPFNRAQMDGYALRAAEVGRTESWPVVESIHAGRDAEVTVPPGQCVAIATGAPLPDDVDTVIQHELSDRADPVRFTITEIASGHAVHPRGADARAGDLLVAPGTLLSAQHLAIAATVGVTTPTVQCAPRAVVLTSGDEVMAPDANVLPHQIRNSNGVMLSALLTRIGADVVRHVHVPDTLDATVASVGTALIEADLVITIGGISAGRRDHFPAAFDAHHVKTRLHGAAIQPGKPIFVGHAARPDGPTDAPPRVVIGLPGNPVSSLACACLFVWPIVRRLLDLDAPLPWRHRVLAEPVRPNPRRWAFRPARMSRDERIVVPRWAGSGDLVHTGDTHGLVALPRQEEPVPASTELPFLAWP